VFTNKIFTTSLFRSAEKRREILWKRAFLQVGGGGCCLAKVEGRDKEGIC
jgi:hypothetical protein